MAEAIIALDLGCRIADDIRLEVVGEPYERVFARIRNRVVAE